MKRILTISLLLSLISHIGIGQTCTVKASSNSKNLLCGDTLKLNAIGNGVLAFRNNFNCGAVQCPQGSSTDPNANFGTWTNSSTAQFNNPCLPAHPSGTPHIWFNQNSPSPRQLATADLPLGTGGVINWDMRFADPDNNGNTSPCENPDASDEGVHVQYSTNGGATWNDIAIYSPNGGNDPERTVWTSYSVGIPLAAQSNNTRIRWVQLSNTGTPGDYLDHWGLDNAEIVVNPPTASYTWSHTGIAKPTGLDSAFVPVVTNTYTVTYNDGTSTCTDQITINVSKPTISVTKNPTTPVCPGTPVQLTATSSLQIPNYTCGKSGTGCLGNTAVIDIGTGTVNNTDYYFFGTPPTGGGGVSTCFNGSGNTVNTARTQFIVRASEIPTLFKKGQIYQIYLNATAAGSYANFTVKIGCTSKTEFASATDFQTGMLEVYSKPNQAFIAGFNAIDFKDAYDWDGTSNLIFEVCYNSDATNSGNVFKTTTTYNSVIHAESCTSSACNTTIAAKVDNDRPTIKLGVCYRPDPDLIYSWTPNFNLSDDSIRNPIASPTSQTTYTVTVRDRNTPAQCAVTENITINMNSIGALDAQYDPICGSGPLQLRGIITPPAGTTFLWTGPGGYSSTNQNPIRDPAVAGRYYFEASNGGCKGLDSVDVVIDEVPRPGNPYTADVCQIENAYNLFAGLTGNPHTTGTWAATGNPSGAAGLSGFMLDASKLITVPGTYTFEHTVDLNNSCGPRKATVTINVKKQPFAGVDSSFIICNSGSVVALFPRLKPNTAGRNPDMAGIWSDESTVKAGSKFTPSTSDLNVNGLAAGNYIFRYIIGDNLPCKADTGFVNVRVENQVDAGENGVGEVCYDGVAPLSTMLGGTVTPGGTWRKKTSFNGTLDPTTGAYTTTGNVADTGTFVFVYTVMATAPCKADSNTVTLKINGYPVISNPMTSCASDGQSFTVTFSVSGGEPSSYSVDKSGTFSGSNPRMFTSSAIPNGTTETFTVTDAKGCKSDMTTLSKDCFCITEAGTMDLTPQILCDGTSSTDSYLGGFVNDGNDASAYYLHTGNASTLIGVVDSNFTGIFEYNAAKMSFGTQYFISVAAANATAANYPSRSDLCLTVAPGTPVLWNENPAGSISGSKNICPGDAAPITLTATKGRSPFSIDVNNDQGGSQSVASLNSGESFDVSPMVTTDYSLVKITDANGCSSTLSSPAVKINVNTAPTGTLSLVKECSDGASNPGTVNIAVTGSGTLFTAVIGNNLNSNKETVSNFAPPGINYNPTQYDPNAAIIYTLESITDNSGSICPPVPSGSATIYPEPTASIVSGGGTYCQGQTVTLGFTLTGVGPWDLVYSDGVNSTPTLATTKNHSVSFTATTAGTFSYSLISVTDKAAPGLCSGVVSGTANVVVNPAVTIDVFVEDPAVGKRVKADEYCDANPSVARNLVFVVDPQSGAGNNFDVIYTTNGGSPVSVQVSRPETKVSVNPGNSTNPYLYALSSIKDQTPSQCPGSGNGASIKVNALPFANIISPNGQICLGQSTNITLIVGGTGPINYTVQGSGADTKTYSGSAQPGQTTVNVTPTLAGQATYTITLISDANNPMCSGSSSSSVVITVNPAPTATFNTAPFEICQGTPLVLRYALTGNGQISATYSGNTTPKTITRVAGPNYTETINGLAPGNYTFTFTSVTDGSNPSCQSTGNSVSGVVRPTPTATLSLSKNPVCSGEPVTMTMTLTGNPNFSVNYRDQLGMNYPQQTGIVSTRTVSIPSDVSRTFTITQISDGSNPICINPSGPAISLTVNPLPVGSLSGSEEICEGGNTSIDVNLVGVAPFTVVFDETSSQGTTPRNATYSTQGTNSFPSNPTDSVVYTNLVITDGNGCVNQGTGSARVNVNPIPKPAFTIDPPFGCSPLVSTFTNIPEGNYNYQSVIWNFGDNSPLVDDPSGNPQVHTFLDRITYSTSLTIISAQGCTGTATENVTVYPDPRAEFSWSPQPVDIQNNNVRFLNRSVGGVNYSWSFGTGDSSKSFEPYYSFPETPETTYPICLIANSGFGCADTLCQPLLVKGLTLVNIPNSFTPNGDGINDLWTSRYFGLRPDFFELFIYDRWGQLVFQTNDPDEKWDGFSLNREECKGDTYVYRMTAKSEYSGDKIEKSGHVTLIR